MWSAKIIDIGTKILNPQLKYYLISKQFYRCLKKELMISLQNYQGNQGSQSCRGIGELLKNNIKQWIQR